jgi:hypothetical protein
MRIYDADSKKSLESITLLLTPSEAKDLADAAADLAAHPQKHHCHVHDGGFTREIIVAVHTADNLSQFDAESRRVIDSP